jgi:TonB family protein
MKLRTCPFLVILLATLLQAHTRPPQASRSAGIRKISGESELLLFSRALRESHFAAVSRGTSSNGCEETRPPEAITTPTPLLAAGGDGNEVVVSFIVGTDGRVHSPLILVGGDAEQDRVVIGAVSNWRYRPATCNGAPTEVEGKVEFSRR